MRLSKEQINMSEKKAVIIAMPVLLTGGTEVHTLALVRVLVGSGYAVTVCCYYELDESMVTLMTYAGAEVRLLKLNRTEGLLSLLGELKDLFRRQKPDIVHVQYLAPGLIPILAAKLAGIKTIFATVHISGRIAYGIKPKLFLRAASFLCTAFFCVSRGTEEFWFGSSEVFNAASARKGRRHFTIYNSVDVERISSAAEAADKKEIRRSLSLSNRFVLGIAGRLAYQKGHAVLLDALPAILEKEPSVVLLIIGKGPERSALEEKARQLGIEKNIIWAGEKSQEEVFSLLGIIDVFLVPSLYEGFGLVAAEAMAAGKPVVASDVDGLCEIIDDGETGILVPPGNSGLLASAISTLLERPDWPKAWGKKGILK
jgi:L-malate glycosyltransferase